MSNHTQEEHEEVMRRLDEQEETARRIELRVQRLEREAELFRRAHTHENGDDDQ